MRQIGGVFFFSKDEILIEVIKKCENYDKFRSLNQSFANISPLPKKYSTDLSHFASV